MSQLRRLQRLMQLPAYLWAGILVIAMLLLLTLATRSKPIPGALRVDRAQLSLPGDPSVADRVVALPHEWAPSRRDWGGLARYRFSLPEDLDEAARREGVGILIPRVGVGFQAKFNGEVVRSQCWPVSSYVYCDAGLQAQMVWIPAGLLRPHWGDNVVEIDVAGQPLRIGGLSDLRVGPSSVLQDRFKTLSWWQSDLTWMVAATAFMMGLLSTLIWLRIREPLFGLLGWGLLILTVRLALSTTISLSGGFAVWDYLHKVSFTLYCGFIYLFMSELFDFRQGKVRKTVIAMMVIGPFCIALTVLLEDYRIYRVWNGAILLMCLLAMLIVFRRARWGLNVNQRLMVVVGLATTITGMRDYFVVHLLVPGDADLRWMTPGSLVLMFAMGWVLTRRTAMAFDHVSLSNAKLLRQVDEREAELRSLFERLRLVESQRVLEAERRRLTRDMHDGLGSQLVQALNVVRGGGDQVDSAAVADMLKHALEDLRITLDSLEPMEGDLPTILGTLRQRLAPALQAARIELEWQVQEVPPIPGLEARGVLHVFRCLQEVFANVLKHAQATRVAVRTVHEGDHVELSVCDDGVGLGRFDGQVSAGRGMGNIRLRAAELGVDVRFEDGRPGTCVRFRFPLRPGARDCD
ncbi:MAG: hypothetical protein JNK17_04505 [Hydrogenophaga sp.]|nr:hypothetical protein [Hydrogenophaga sp.]